MITGEARKGRWLVATDVIYLDFSGADSAVRSVDLNPGPGRVNVSTSELNAGTEQRAQGLGVDAVGGYAAMQDPRWSLDVLGGFRLLDIKATTDWNLTATVDRDRSGRSNGDLRAQRQRGRDGQHLGRDRRRERPGEAGRRQLVRRLLRRRRGRSGIRSPGRAWRESGMRSGGARSSSTTGISTTARAATSSSTTSASAASRSARTSGSDPSSCLTSGARCSSTAKPGAAWMCDSRRRRPTRRKGRPLGFWRAGEARSYSSARRRNECSPALATDDQGLPSGDSLGQYGKVSHHARGAR